MPKQKQPIKRRPNSAEDSVDDVAVSKGKHREDDEALPGRGGTKGGLNRASSGGGGKQNEGRPG